MPTIAIVSQKGGSGKTTLALNLATSAVAAGHGACVIDIDPQATAAAWGDWREGAPPEVVTCPPVRVSTTVLAAQRKGAKVIVIDTPPHADLAAREAVRVADLVLVPTRPRAFDLHAVEATAELMSMVSKPAFLVLNGVPARASRVVEETAGIAARLGLPLCPVRLCERAAFHRAAASGHVASETEPDSKAAEEAAALWGWAAGQVGLG